MWGTALDRLEQLFPTHACQEFLASYPALGFRWVVVAGWQDVVVPGWQDVPPRQPVPLFWRSLPASRTMWRGSIVQRAMGVQLAPSSC